MQYKAVLFDLDGTLLDTLDDLTASVNHAMRSCGFPEHSREAVRRFVGNGVRNLSRRAVPGGEDNPRFEEAMAAQVQYYREHNRVQTKPYEGVIEALGKLRGQGLRVAILSNKDEVAVMSLCEHFFPGLYDLALGNLPGERPRKPDPAIVFAALERFGIRPDEALYVGDSETDAATAEAAGLSYLLVAWGFRDRDVLSQFAAKAIIHTPGEWMRYV